MKWTESTSLVKRALGTFGLWLVGYLIVVGGFMLVWGVFGLMVLGWEALG
jgi:hypothetical protein